MPISAFKLITPTSIVVGGGTASVGQFGKVSFSAATSLSLNGVFSSTYDNYMIVCRLTSSGTATVNCRLRANGTDNSTANSYVTQELTASSTTLGPGRYTANVAYVVPTYATQRCGFSWFLFGPYLVQPTAGRSVTVSDSSSAFLYDAAFTHNQSVAYDGFTLDRSANNISGEIAVYGCNQ